MSKTAVVTGSNRGIGKAIALKLSEAGMWVVLCARDQAMLNATASEIGGETAAISLDLREPSAGTELVDFAIAKFGSIDVVVNNAGATKRGEFDALTDDDWADGFALKFFGAVRVTRAAWPHLKKSCGSVLFISGSGGRTPGAQFSIGGAVNAGLLSLTKALAETGIRDGIQVNAINPGLTRTERLTRRVTALAESEGVNIAEAEKLLIREERIAQIGSPEEIAALAAFIVGPHGRFLQGSLIDMDGGSTKTI